MAKSSVKHRAISVRQGNNLAILAHKTGINRPASTYACVWKKIQGEADRHKQQHLRVLAEYDNFRKRSANEKNAVYNNAVSDTINAILPVADNIDRALAQENVSAEDMKKGVEMIASQFKASFEKLGIREVGQVGEPFDPALHNAVAHIESDELGENVISAVFQKGYMLGDKVVRHAMVQVAN